MADIATFVTFNRIRPYQDPQITVEWGMADGGMGNGSRGEEG